MPDIMRPMEEKLKEDLSEQEHGNITAKLEIEHFEIIVKHDDGLRDCKRELALHYYLDTLVENEIVEGCWHLFLLLA